MLVIRGVSPPRQQKLYAVGSGLNTPCTTQVSWFIRYLYTAFAPQPSYMSESYSYIPTQLEKYRVSSHHATGLDQERWKHLYTFLKFACRASKLYVVVPRLEI